MSGGHYDYACHRIDDLADAIEAGLEPCRCDLSDGRFCECSSAHIVGSNVIAHRRAFVVLLRHVARAAHDIEWVDSGDYGSGRELPAIRKALGIPEVDGE